MPNPLILVVEDHVITQKVMRVLCEEFKFNAVIVGSCKEAEEALLESAVFDMIFMDLRLPDKPGEVCALELRGNKATSRIPIIGMSGLVGEEQKRCMDFGLDDFLAKPFTALEFKQMVLKWSRRDRDVIHASVDGDTHSSPDRAD